jgi:hypothetical protein
MFVREIPAKSAHEVMRREQGSADWRYQTVLNRMKIWKPIPNVAHGIREGPSAPYCRLFAKAS